MATQTVSLIVTAAALTAANSALSAALGQSAEFTIPLGPTEDGIVTHYGAQLNASDAVRLAIQRQEMAPPDGTSIDWKRYEYKRTSAYTLYVTNSASAQAAVGTTYSFAAAAADQGLVVVVGLPMLLVAGGE